MCPQRELIFNSYPNGDANLNQKLANHVADCSYCQDYLDDFDHVAQLTETINPYQVNLDQIEIQVYKRLAIEAKTEISSTNSIDKQHRNLGWINLLVHLRGIIRFFWFNLHVRQLFWLTALTVVLLVSWKYVTPKNNLNSSTSISRPRLEIFRQEQLRQHIEEANAMQYLKNDSQTSQSILRLVKEQAQGTELESYAGQQIQIAQSQRR